MVQLCPGTQRISERLTITLYDWYGSSGETGEVHQVTRKGIHYAATYTANWAPALSLYDDLIDLGEGPVPAYINARTILMNWIEAFPMRTNRWGPFFEDVATHRYSDTETNADTMAAYFLKHSDKIADWRQKVESIQIRQVRRVVPYDTLSLFGLLQHPVEAQ